MSKSLVVDADGHILEPPDLWERYLEPKHRERAMRIKTGQRGWEYLEIDGNVSRLVRGGVMGALGGAYQDPRELLTPGKVKYWEGAKRTPGAIDPDASVREMDAQGIDATVLYPTIGILWEEECTDPELSAAYCRASNNYLFGFCREHPDRLVPIAQVNLRDVNLAVTEVERVKGKARGIFTTPYPINGIPVGDPITIHSGPRAKQPAFPSRPTCRCGRASSATICMCRRVNSPPRKTLFGSSSCNYPTIRSWDLTA